MENPIKQEFHSIEELLSSCSSSELRRFVSSQIKNKSDLGWSLVACLADDDGWFSEFVAPVEGTDLMHRLTWRICERGQFGSLDITTLEPLGVPEE